LRLGRLAQEAFQGRQKDHPIKVLLDRQDTGGTEPAILILAMTG
jgi:hypothetical protein